MPATALKCRVCDTEYPLDPIGVCARCFGPLDPVYDRDEQRRTVSRESIAAGPHRSGATRRCCPSRRRPSSASRRAGRRSSPAPRLAEALGVGELWLKLDTANPTHSFKDRVVAVAAAKAHRARPHDARVLVDRQSRERRRRTRCGRGARGRRSLPGRPRAGEARRNGHLRRADLRRRGQLRRLQPPQGRAVVRARLGVRERRPPRVLRGGLEDARASRSPSSSAGRCRTR